MMKQLEINEQTPYGKTYRTVVVERNVTGLVLIRNLRKDIHIHSENTHTVVGVAES